MRFELKKKKEKFLSCTSSAIDSFHIKKKKPQYDVGSKEDDGLISLGRGFYLPVCSL